MANFSLATLNESSSAVKQIKTALKKSVGQEIVAVFPDAKIKKVAGETTREMFFNLENGQSVSFIFRKDGDILRVKLNGKDRPIKGDLDVSYKPTFNAAIAEIADFVRANQAKFDKDQQKKKVQLIESSAAEKTENTAKERALSVKKQIDITNESLLLLDEQIVKKTGDLSLYQNQLAQLQTNYQNMA